MASSSQDKVESSETEQDGKSPTLMEAVLTIFNMSYII